MKDLEWSSKETELHGPMVLKLGLFDSDFQVTDDMDWQRKKIVMNTGLAILIAMMYDNIMSSTNDQAYSIKTGEIENVVDNSTHSVNLTLAIEAITAPITEQYVKTGALNGVIDETYLESAFLILDTVLAGTLNSSLTNVLKAIEQLPENNPLNIMVKNLNKYLDFGNKNKLIIPNTLTHYTLTEFIGLGIKTQVRTEFAILNECISLFRKHHANIFNEQRGINLDQLLEMFKRSLGIVIFLAKGDRNIKADALISLLTYQEIAPGSNHTTLYFKHGALDLVGFSSKNVGTPVINQEAWKIVEEAIREINASEDDVKRRGHPRVYTECPASAPLDGASNVIHGVHNMAYLLLHFYNEKCKVKREAN